MEQLISLLVENQPGALMRVAGVLTSRGYNIASLTVAKTLDPTLSSMTIVVDGVSEENKELLVKQITRLVNVIKAVDLTDSKAVQRELALIKVSSVRPDMRSALTREAEIFRARVVDVAPTHYTLEVTGSPEKIDALIDLLHHYGDVEMIRSGSMAIAREPKNQLPTPLFRMDDSETTLEQAAVDSK
jgi:acetolactate synthase I/III small subunit